MFTRKEKGLLEENKRENKVLTSTSSRIGSRRTSTLGVHPLLGDSASRTRKRNQGSDGQAKTYYFGLPKMSRLHLSALVFNSSPWQGRN
jgi:hypothetical protein